MYSEFADEPVPVDLAEASENLLGHDVAVHDLASRGTNGLAIVEGAVSDAGDSIAKADKACSVPIVGMFREAADGSV